MTETQPALLSGLRLASGSAAARVAGPIRRQTARAAGLLGLQDGVGRRLPSSICRPGAANRATVASRCDRHVPLPSRGTDAYPLLLAVGLVAATAAGLLLAGRTLPAGHVALIFLAPVLICATQWGSLPALAAAFTGMAADRLLFEPHPLVAADLPETIDLMLFAAVTAAACNLAGRLRLETANARLHEQEVQRKDKEIDAAHRYSRKLLASGTVADVHLAMRTHCWKDLHTATVIIGGCDHVATQLRAQDGVALPEMVRIALSRMTRGGGLRSEVMFDNATRRHWLVRAVSSRTTDYGIIAADLGDRPPDATAALRRHIEAAICDAAAMIEHLEVVRLVEDAKSRQQQAAPALCASS